MSTRLRDYVTTALKPSVTAVRTGVLQRKCACGHHTVAGGECAGCRDSRKGVLRWAAVGPSLGSDLLSLVHQVTHSPGQPLDLATRAFMEPRFGHDFSRVRVHTGARAAESARAVNALAYTVGQNLIFGAGQYMPGTTQGKKLLAHELTHVLQQAGPSTRADGVSDQVAEREAGENSERILGDGKVAAHGYSLAGVLQRQQSPQSQTSLDATAQGIINIAQNNQRDLGMRAVQVVYRIISAYYSTDASLVSGVGYEEGLSGLATDLSGSGSQTRAMIRVGKYFVEHTNSTHFARRVLQVGHELDHIKDWRTGIAGPRRSDEREFRAYYREATAQEKPHTGRMQHSTRVSLIDAALGYYYCLSQPLQQQYVTEQQDLLNRRPTEVRQSGNPAPPPPTSCSRASN